VLEKIWTSRVTIRITRFAIYSTYVWHLIYVNSRRNGCYLNRSNVVFQNRELFRISRELQYPASLSCSYTEDFSKYDRNIKNWSSSYSPFALVYYAGILFCGLFEYRYATEIYGRACSKA